MLIIKKIISVLAALTLTLGLTGGAWAEAPQPSAEAAVVMTEDGQVLFDRNGSGRALIASTTKLMTAIVTIEKAELNELVDIKPEFCNIEGSSMYLKPGERYTVKELLLGLLLVSGNDAAQALACHVAGSGSDFARLMNAQAARIGMEDSSFANPHGLDEAGHYSTALDMAKLMNYCMDNQVFAGLCSMKSAVIKGQFLENHNKLLQIYPGCVGGKTGYTQAAGRCLVSCCERGGLRLVCVTLSAPDDWNDHMSLYEWAFGRFVLKDVLEGQSFQIPVVSGVEDAVNIVPESGMELYLSGDRQVCLRAEMPRFVFAPLNKGETAGRIWVIINEKTVGSCALVYEKDVAEAAGNMT